MKAQELCLINFVIKLANAEAPTFVWAVVCKVNYKLYIAQHVNDHR